MREVIANRMMRRLVDDGFLARMTPPAVAVFPVLLLHSDMGVSAPSIKTISTQSGLDPDGVQRGLAELVGLGLIIAEDEGWSFPP